MLSPHIRSFDFAYIDGLKISTDKSTLLSKLKVRIITDAPRQVDVCIVDGMFLVQSHVDFGGEANMTLSRLVRRANRVDFACGTYTCKYPMIIPEKIMVWYMEK